MAGENTLLNALIGAVVAVVLAFVPFSPVLGGATAGYLQGGDQSDALRVGALSGLFASIPLVLLMMLLATVIPFLPAFGMPGSMTAIVGVFALLAFAVILLYSIGLGALGGALGRYIAREMDL
ncbi:DUF5518 domain-containing protein [Halorhabdus amylolytica]|uniref:DUF5518 domain-containing protein n=1 Tax=Halorhabdus amylolytica TaxID=2559573 RepID=UPI0010AB4387|nr:DUF5518 domain-containing protein [Halorhabdus amylolytica]